MAANATSASTRCDGNAGNAWTTSAPTSMASAVTGRKISASGNRMRNLSRLAQRALVQLQHPIHAPRQRIVVRDQDQTGPDFAIELEHQRVDLRCVLLVEIAGRLIGEYAGRRSEERRVGKECRSRWS